MNEIVIKIIAGIISVCVVLLIIYIIYKYAGGKISYFFSQTISQITDSGYGRGVGKPIYTCSSDKEKDGLLCYPKCRDSYKGVGPVCWTSCPSNTTDLGAVCTKHSHPQKLRPCSDWDSSYRDDGTSCWLDAHIYGKGCCCTIFSKDCCNNCPPGYTDDGCTCRRNNIGIKVTAMERAYCEDGYKLFGGVCYATCNGDTTDTVTQCQKKSYGRTAGTPLECGDNEDLDAGLCYPKCKDGYKGVGPMCWKK
jgi:hypothetical protein